MNENSVARIYDEGVDAAVSDVMEHIGKCGMNQTHLWAGSVSIVSTVMNGQENSRDHLVSLFCAAAVRLAMIEWTRKNDNV